MMVTMDEASRTPRCTMRGCPVRYRSGDDRPCRGHRDDDGTVSLAERMTAIGVDVTAAPAGRHDDSATTTTTTTG